MTEAIGFLQVLSYYYPWVSFTAFVVCGLAFIAVGVAALTFIEKLSGGTP